VEHPIDDRLRDEVRRFRLVFTCASCSHFDPEPTRCTLGYPTQPHRSEDLHEREMLSFCKHFEMW